MRVVAGKYKGRQFFVPRSFKARPTTDFAKENLFNVLRGYIDFDEATEALDLFAGTGSITLELLSRGCGRVVSVEKEPLHYGFITSFLDKIGERNCFPVKADVFKYIASTQEKFDFIFADPPYTLPNIHELPDLVCRYGLLREGGLFVLEHGKGDDFSAHPHIVDHRQYGSVNFSFFRWA